MKQVILFLICSLLFFHCSKTAGERDGLSAFPVLKGAYLGQTPPGDEPELFAPGIVTTELATRDVAIMPDGNEIYFCISTGSYRYSKILVTRLKNGAWTEPEVAVFAQNPGFMDIEPCISPDGSRFFFLSDRPDEAHGRTGKNADIWYMEREGDGWGKPQNPGPPVNTEAREYFPSVTSDGTLYFSRAEPNSRIHYIYRSKYSNGTYQEPEKLGPNVNCGASQFNAFIAPDESYLIVCVAGRNDTYGSTDYYIVFRNKDDKWSSPVNMGDKINTAGGREYSPYISPDKKYFFFMSTRIRPDIQPLKLSHLLEVNNGPQNGNPDIYWVSATFIDLLRPDGFEEGR